MTTTAGKSDLSAVFVFEPKTERLAAYNDLAARFLDEFSVDERRNLSWPEIENRIAAGSRVVTAAGELPDAATQKEYWRPDGTVIAASCIRVPDSNFVALLTDLTADRQELRRLRLLAALTEHIGRASSLEAAVKALLRAICRHADWQYAEAWLPNPDWMSLTLGPVWHMGAPGYTAFERHSQQLTLKPDEGIAGRVWARKTAEHISNLAETSPETHPRRDEAMAAGFRCLHSVPLMVDDKFVAVLTFASAAPRPRDRLILDLIKAISPQLSTALMRKQLEQRTSAANQRFADLLDSAGDAIVSIDASHRIILFNRQAERIFGYSADEALGKPLDLLLPSDSHDTHRRKVMAFGDAADRRRVMGGRPEVRGRRKDGTEFPAEASISSLTTDDGVIFTAVLRDLTALRKAEAAVLDRERQLRNVIEAMPIGVSISRLSDGTFLYTNDSMSQLIQAPSKTLIGRSTLDYYHDPVERKSLIDKLQTHRRREDIKVRIRTATGAERWVLCSAALIDYNGEEAVLAGLNDETDRHEALASLQQSERSLAEAQRIARLGNWNWNIADNHLTWSDEIYRIFGLRAQEFAATYPAFLERVHPDDRAAVEAAVRRALAGDEAYSIDHRIVRPDGTIRIVHEQGEITRDAQGVPVRMIGTVQDITERKQIEEALRSARDQAEAASHAKSQFLAHMSHELRTPLNAIIGFSEIIMNERLGRIGVPRYREYGGDIHDSGHLLLGIISNVLDLSRIEAGRMQLEETEADIADTLTTCIRLLRDRMAAAGIQCDYAEPVGLPRIHADQRLLKQIFLNLLSNAIKFTPAGGLIRVAARSENGGTISVLISDTGIGMAPSDIGEAMKPFTQIGPLLSRSYEGTGLGLPLADAFVRLHDGDLSIASERGVGTTVTVRFPSKRLVTPYAATAA